MAASASASSWSGASCGAATLRGYKDPSPVSFGWLAGMLTAKTLPVRQSAPARHKLSGQAVLGVAVRPRHGDGSAGMPILVIMADQAGATLQPLRRSVARPRADEPREPTA